MTPSFLIDTMVISENFKRRPHPAAHQWLASADSGSIAVSVITFGEIAAGLEKLHSTELAFVRLAAWLKETVREFDSRTLPVTSNIAMRWGALCTRLKRRDTDLLIAATALEYGLTVVTRNVRHFEPAGVDLLNPYDPA